MNPTRPENFGHWLFLRLAVTSLVLTVGVVLLAIAAEGLPRAPLFACLVVEYLAVAGGVLAARAGASTRRVMQFQVMLDVAVIATCVHFTGGVGSDFVLLYFFPVLLAAWALRRRWALITASAAAAATLAYTLLVTAGHLVPAPLVVRSGLLDGGAIIEGHFAITLLLVVGYLAGEMSGRLEQRADLLSCQRRELARVRRETKGILDSMSSGLMTLDTQGRVQRLNPAAEQILGVGQELLVGRPVSDSLGGIMPVLVGHLTECLAEGRSGDRIELNIEHGAGAGTVPLGLSVSRLQGRDGQATGVIAVFQDLSAVVRMREQVRKNDKLAAMGELSASIAHEIRNPLASIRGSVEMLVGELEVDGENARLMELILKESERLNRIANDFLEYARLKPAAMRNVRLVELLEDTVRALQLREDRPGGISVRLVGCGEDPVVHADEELVRQVFVNLGLNAFQAMGDEGQLEIRLQLQPEGVPARVVVRFLDSGSGIDEEDLPRLFEPFFTTKKSGTGLGLPLANRIVGNHGGTIEAQNQDGGGAEFTVTLPLLGLWRDGHMIEGEAMAEGLLAPLAEASGE